MIWFKRLDVDWGQSESEETDFQPGFQYSYYMCPFVMGSGRGVVTLGKTGLAFRFESWSKDIGILGLRLK